MTIFVATHKDSILKVKPGYEMIQVGAVINKHFCNVTDDTGDNISIKNPHYCELTAQYWIWRNYTDDIVGLCHYRRFFYSWPAYILKTIFGIPTKMLSERKIKRVLSSKDAIVTLPCFLSKTVWARYAISHYIYDLECAKKAIELKYPDYMPAFNKVMHGKKYHYGNMIICKKALFDSYSKWLFDILEYVENRTDVSARSPYQQRAYGFLSERLMDVFLTANNINYKEFPVIVTDSPYLVVQVFQFLSERIKKYFRIGK